MIRPLLLLVCATSAALACSAASSGAPAREVEAGADARAAADGAASSGDCSPACGGSAYCREALLPAQCAMHALDGSAHCPEGCPGCPPLPAPACAALPADCNGTPSCACLLPVCPAGAGPVPGTCAMNGAGDWVVACLGS